MKKSVNVFNLYLCHTGNNVRCADSRIDIGEESVALHRADS